MMASAKDGTGKNPIWNSSFTSNANSIYELVEIKVMGKDTSSAEITIGALVRTI